MSESQLQQACRQVIGAPVIDVRRVGGGSISTAWRVQTRGGPVFVKSTAVSNADWFVAEADGLQALVRCPAIRVPEVLGTTRTSASAWLFLGWLDMTGADAGDDERLGRALACLHEISAPRFGWERDNFIGATAQSNGWSDDWCEFFCERRLRPQLELAARNGYGDALRTPGDALLRGLPKILSAKEIRPSLLHGDLWSGNRGVAADGMPVLYDPAVYFGDGESDMAMTELFGGFGPAFYAAYAEMRPSRGDVGARRDVYRLYHLLNHLNLFGAAYLAQSQALMRQISAVC